MPWVLAAVLALYFQCVGTAQLNICWGFRGCGWDLCVLRFWVLGQRGLDTGLPQADGGTGAFGRQLINDTDAHFLRRGHVAQL